MFNTIWYLLSFLALSFFSLLSLAHALLCLPTATPSDAMLLNTITESAFDYCSLFSIYNYPQPPPFAPQQCNMELASKWTQSSSSELAEQRRKSEDDQKWCLKAVK